MKWDYGKTLQVITFIQSLDKDKKILIVCPKTLMYNWSQEFEKFFIKIPYQIINGTPKQRQDKINNIQDYRVNITSYPLITKDINLYNDKKLDYVFFDEMQMIKNYKSKSAVSCKLLKAKRKFAVTGTPIENNVLELWSLFNIINPNYFGDITNFRRNFHKLRNEETDGILHNSINHFLLKRHKKDVLKELPDKIIDEIELKLSKSQQKEYDRLVDMYKATIENEINTNGINKSYITILSLLTRLRQICCHPKLFLKDYKGESSKLEACLDIVKEIKSEGRKVLIFSNFKSLLDIVKEELEENDISNYYINGSTNENNRRDMIENFNKDNTTAFLLSIKAGGVGINLTSADTVIILDPWWNPQVENQAIDRAHRMGQKNKVQVIKLITADTIEEKIISMQKDKLDMYNRIIKSDADILTRLTKEEILKLFTNKG